MILSENRFPLFGIMRSRDDVGRQLVFDRVDAVAQIELALLQALHLQNVGPARILERRDGGIEVAMFLQEPRQLRAELAFFLVGHRRPLGGRYHRAPAAKS